MQPKMGKIDIDFQVLHDNDAFFKHQTKPKMTGHGDLYYEGKEFLKEKKAGILSNEPRIALGMTSDTVPSPWLVNMQNAEVWPASVLPHAMHPWAERTRPLGGTIRFPCLRMGQAAR